MHQGRVAAHDCPWTDLSDCPKHIEQSSYCQKHADGQIWIRGTWFQMCLDLIMEVLILPVEDGTGWLVEVPPRLQQDQRWVQVYGPIQTGTGPLSLANTPLYGNAVALLLNSERGACSPCWPMKLRKKRPGEYLTLRLRARKGRKDPANATLPVHRLVCHAIHGAPPAPEGWDAAHSCGNRACCNPAHLSWQTWQQNRGVDRVLAIAARQAADAAWIEARLARLAHARMFRSGAPLTPSPCTAANLLTSWRALITLRIGHRRGIAAELPALPAPELRRSNRLRQVLILPAQPTCPCMLAVLRPYRHQCRATHRPRRYLWLMHAFRVTRKVRLAAISLPPATSCLTTVPQLSLKSGGVPSSDPAASLDSTALGLRLTCIWLC